MQRFKSGVGDAVHARAFHFRSERKHRAEHFADGCNVVLRNPASELEQGRVEYGRGIEDLENVFRCDLRLAIMQLNNDSGKTLFAEGYEYASADYGNVSVYAVGENDVERYWNRDVAELRLSRHAENMLQVGSYG